MTHYGAKELAASFRQVRKNTVQAAEDIPDSQYGFHAASDCRTVGQMLTHIALSPRLHLHIQQNRVTDVMSVDFPALIQQMALEEAKPRSKAEIIALLETEGDAVEAYLAGLSEGFLAETVAMPPGVEPPLKSRLEMLLSIKEHEMHHRGQLMLLQRMLGITPHLTKQMQERMARGAAAAQPAR